MQTVVPISALEHFSYCPRQCALIHVEASFVDNLWTAQGTAAHRRVDEGGGWKGGRNIRSLVVFSDHLQLIGRCDVVEMDAANVPYPVEYKNGPSRGWLHETIQLCAQAMCLEEMFSTDVVEGAVYYAGSRRRRQVYFSPALRRRTAEVITATRELLDTGVVPVMKAAPRCRRCSLRPICLPEATGRPRAIAAYASSLKRSTDG